MNSILPWKSDIAWRHLGKIYPDDGGFKIAEEEAPLTKEQSGLYCLHFNGSNFWYVGQSKRLKKRLSEYRKPTLGTLQEYYIREALEEFGGAQVYIAEIDLNLRHSTERTEIKCAHDAKVHLLNRVKPIHSHVKKLLARASDKARDDWLKGLQFIEEEEIK